MGTKRFNVLACGRRFGKTVYGEHRLVPPMLAGHPVAWFAPRFKYLNEVWRDFRRTLLPVTSHKNEQERRIELITGGSIDFWSLEDPDSGRGRKYKRVVIDEAAKAKNLEAAWQEAIRPTLTDLEGDADLLSTPKGRNFFWKAYVKGLDPLEPEWACWRMPTLANPFINPLEIEAARRQLPARVFAQEYEAEFLEDAGGVFRCVPAAVDQGRCENEPPRKGETYFCGVDLARTQDFTVIAIFDSRGRQVYFERFNQISWERQISAIVAAAGRYNNADIVLDCTGVGDPIFERLRDSDVSVTPYHFTNTSKSKLIDNLAMQLEQGKLRLMDLETQTSELLAYEYELTASRNVRTNAPEGMHDDCVIALALAAWGASQTHYIEVY
jgi:phage terminase large subunit-like protein